ncbi:uncharacterized protein M6G45_009669 isoform 1-T1 [Spheniscus humboldti]
MPGGIVFRHRASGRLCCAPRHAGGCSLPLAEFRSNTQDNTGMPPLEIGLIIGGMLVLLKGVIIASMNQIRFTPRQAQCMGPSDLIHTVKGDLYTVSRPSAFLHQLDAASQATEIWTLKSLITKSTTTKQKHVNNCTS